MPKTSMFFRKIIITFLSFWVLFLSIAPSFNQVSAQTPAPAGTWYNSNFQEWYAKVYDDGNPSEIFGERYTAAQVQWVMYGLWSFLINSATGPENASIVQCFLKSANNITGCTSLLQKLVTKTNEQQVVGYKAPLAPDDRNVWGLVFSPNRSFSGIAYVNDKVQNFSLVPEAHAQSAGFGFSSLEPVQGMWKSFRDIAFGLFVVVAIAFSFMIMFRVKLSPQTVISVQSALPKIVGSLILVTFSYAIAGFLVDLMYVFIGILSFTADGLFKNSLGISLGATPFFNFLTLGQPFGSGLIGSVVTGGAPQQGVLLMSAIYIGIFFLPFVVFILIATSPIAIFGGPAGVTIYVILNVLIIIIAFIVALWTVIKIVWSLLKAFVNILLLTIFAPVQIAAGTIIPALGFGQWLRSFVSNLAVFVVVGALFLFSFLFMIPGIVIGFKTVAGLAVALLTPLLGGFAISSVLSNFVANPSWPPLLGGGSDAMVGILFFGVSFVLFTLTPKAAEIIQGLMSGKPFAYGSAIGEAFGGVGAAYGMSGAKDYVEAIQSIRQNRMWGKILSSKPGKRVSETLVGGPTDSRDTAVEQIIAEKSKRSGGSKYR